MALAIFPVLLVIIGALAYGLCQNPKAAELGRITFFVGLFWTCSVLASHVVRIG